MLKVIGGIIWQDLAFNQKRYNTEKINFACTLTLKLTCLLFRGMANPLESFRSFSFDREIKSLGNGCGDGISIIILCYCNYIWHMCGPFTRWNLFPKLFCSENKRRQACLNQCCQQGAIQGAGQFYQHLLTM